MSTSLSVHLYDSTAQGHPAMLPTEDEYRALFPHLSAAQMSESSKPFVPTPLDSRRYFWRKVWQIATVNGVVVDTFNRLRLVYVYIVTIVLGSMWAKFFEARVEFAFQDGMSIDWGKTGTDFITCVIISICIGSVFVIYLGLDWLYYANFVPAYRVINRNMFNIYIERGRRIFPYLKSHAIDYNSDDPADEAYKHFRNIDSKSEKAAIEKLHRKRDALSAIVPDDVESQFPKLAPVKYPKKSTRSWFG